MDLGLPRRRFLTLSLLFLVRPRSASADVKGPLNRPYEVDVSVLFNLITFALKGTVVKEIDHAAGRYRVSMNGEGTASPCTPRRAGMIQARALHALEIHSHSTIRGRESRLDMTYDHDRGTVEYHSVMHTFFLGRRRQVDDRSSCRPTAAWTISSRPSSTSPPTCWSGTRTARIGPSSSAARDRKTRAPTTSPQAATMPS